MPRLFLFDVEVVMLICNSILLLTDIHCISLFLYHLKLCDELRISSAVIYVACFAINLGGLSCSVVCVILDLKRGVYLCQFLKL